MSYIEPVKCNIIFNPIFGESRLAFEGIQELKESKKIGIRFHGIIATFFLKILGKTIDIEDITGKVYHLNRGSLVNWLDKHQAVINKRELNDKEIADTLKNFTEKQASPKIKELYEIRKQLGDKWTKMTALPIYSKQRQQMREEIHDLIDKRDKLLLELK